MHKIERQQCRQLFGYVESTAAPESAYNLLANTCDENKKFVKDFVETFRARFERGSLTKHQVLEGLDLVHDLAIDAFDALSSELEECRTNFSKRIALQNELTDFICKFLEIETAAELVVFQSEFLRQRHGDFIASKIAYLNHPAT